MKAVIFILFAAVVILISYLIVTSSKKYSYEEDSHYYSQAWGRERYVVWLIKGSSVVDVISSDPADCEDSLKSVRRTNAQELVNQLNEARNEK